MEKTMSDKLEPSVQVTVVDIEEGLPPQPSKHKRRFYNFTSLLRRSVHRRNKSEESPWPKIIRRTLYFLVAAGSFLAIAFLIHHALILSLIHKLAPIKPQENGLTQIVSAWVEPGSVTPAPASWLPNFSRDVEPKAIHSHNDYWRRVPLFEALSLGVTGVEADCHLINGVLYVGHKPRSLRPNRTLQSLYLDPLVTILTKQNEGNTIANDTIPSGVWDIDPSHPLVLMTDLKTEGASTLAAVQQALQPFREKGWLTHFNGTTVVPGPIIHVATGNTPFSAVLNSNFSNSTYRDVFFDAPLDALSPAYNITNSYYASTPLPGLFGGSKHIPASGLTKNQVKTVMAQIQTAADMGLVSRYWDIPAWPVGTRLKIWGQLKQAGIGMLNVDALDVAARWNWKVCKILGVDLCS